MVIRLHNVSKWSVLKPGEALDLPGETRRKVRVEINAVQPTRLDVEEDGKFTFLAVVQGLEVVEFAVSGKASLVPTSDDEVWYFTNDGDQLPDASSVTAQSFTKIASRRARNPDLERMMWKMEQNAMRREQMLRAEIDAFRASVETKGADPDTGELRDEPPAPATTDDKAAAGGAGGEDAGGAGGAPVQADAGAGANA